MKKNKLSLSLICIHWLVVLLVLLAFVSIEFRSSLGKHGLFHDVMKSSHTYFGFIILFLTVIRIFIKKISVSVDCLKNSLQRVAAKIVHSLLYVWLVIMPILGWCILSAKGSDIPFSLPALFSPVSREVVLQLEVLHENIAYIGLGVIFIHACAALFNHYVLKNNVLKNMLLRD